MNLNEIRRMQQLAGIQINESVYTENGYASRKEYIYSLADEYGVDVQTVISLAQILGPSEDFDGLITALEDAADQDMMEDSGTTDKFFKVSFTTDSGDWEIYVAGPDETSATKQFSRWSEDLHVEEIPKLPEGKHLNKKYRPQEVLDIRGSDRTPHEDMVESLLTILDMAEGNTSPDISSRISSYIMSKIPQQYWGWAANLASEHGFDDVYYDISMRKGEMGMR